MRVVFGHAEEPITFSESVHQKVAGKDVRRVFDEASKIAAIASSMSGPPQKWIEQPAMRNQFRNRRADLFNDQCRYLRGGHNHCVERIRAQRKRFHLDSRRGHCEPYPSRAFRVVVSIKKCSTSIGAVRKATACKMPAGRRSLVSVIIEAYSNVPSARASKAPDGRER